MPLVLVQNPVIVNQGYDWKDIVGQQYHFPNQYKNRCVPDVPFVYYRGTRRLGGKRATPEYFGHGRIGEVWRDDSIPPDRPKKDWAWYCNIIDYVPFQKLVPAKINGSFLEQIARNHWSVGVRPLTTELFNRIMELAGCQSFEAAQHVDEIALPDIGSITVTEAEPLLIPTTTRSAIGTGNSNGSRHSRFSGPVGRRAEEIAQRFLQTNADQLGARRIRWVSQAGLTPGWDLEYDDERGERIAVEVKGTTAQQFANVELTAGEWRAAMRLGERYWLYLVADCCSTEPVIQRIQDPAQLVKMGQAEITPTVYRFCRIANSV